MKKSLQATRIGRTNGDVGLHNLRCQRLRDVGVVVEGQKIFFGWMAWLAGLGHVLMRCGACVIYAVPSENTAFDGVLYI